MNELEEFVQKLASESKDLEPEIVEMVNEHFWELLLNIEEKQTYEI